MQYHFVINFVEMNLTDFVDNLFAFVRNKAEPYTHAQQQILMKYRTRKQNSRICTRFVILTYIQR